MMMGGPGYVNLETNSGRRARDQLDLLVSDLVPEVVAVGTILDGPLPAGSRCGVRGWTFSSSARAATA